MEALRVNGPGSLVAVIPSLLGYVPTNSILLVPLKNRQVGAIARCDLPVMPRTTPEQVARSIVTPYLLDRPDMVILLTYTDELGQAQSTMDAVTETLHSLGIPINDRISITATTWRSIDCKNPQCCPPEGSPVLSGSDEVEHVRATYGKPPPVANRSLLVEQVSANPDWAKPLPLLPEGSVDLEYCWDTVPIWLALMEDGEYHPPEPEQMGRLALAVTNKQFRDGLVAASTGSMPLDILPGDGLAQRLAPVQAVPRGKHHLRNVAVSVAGLIPDEERSADLLCILGTWAYFDGDGTVALLLLDRATACQPHHTLTALTRTLIKHNINPALLRMVQS